jgi:hypothetical protein
MSSPRYMREPTQIVRSSYVACAYRLRTTIACVMSPEKWKNGGKKRERRHDLALDAVANVSSRRSSSSA